MQPLLRLRQLTFAPRAGLHGTSGCALRLLDNVSLTVAPHDCLVVQHNHWWYGRALHAVLAGWPRSAPHITDGERTVAPGVAVVGLTIPVVDIESVFDSWNDCQRIRRVAEPALRSTVFAARMVQRPHDPSIRLLGRVFAASAWSRALVLSAPLEVPLSNAPHNVQTYELSFGRLAPVQPHPSGHPYVSPYSVGHGRVTDIDAVTALAH